LDALQATRLGHRCNPLIAALLSSVVASDHGPPVASIVLPPVSLSTPSNTSLRHDVSCDEVVAALESDDEERDLFQAGIRNSKEN
jgi:hypothetical protein